MKKVEITVAILAALSASLALSEDLQTIEGKKYKNIKVNRIEPDGIVLRTKSGISKVYFTELPKEAQERFHYNAPSETIEKYGLFLPQRAEEAQITNKLSRIIIPYIDFQDASIREAIEVLREMATENDPERKGVNIVLRPVPLGQIAPPSMRVEPVAPNGTATQGGAGAPLTGAPAAPAQAAVAPNGTATQGGAGAPLTGAPAAPAAPAQAGPGGPAGARITLKLDNIPLGEALRYIANQAGLKLKVDPYAVLLIPITEMVTDDELQEPSSPHRLAFLPPSEPSAFGSR
jgi:general secretion pathway protein D